MGSLFGAALTEAGVQTTVVDVNAELVSRIDAEGLRLIRDGSEQTIELDIRTDVAGLDPAALVVFFVKSFATTAASALVAPAVSSDTVALSLQNGWGADERLASAFDPEQVAIGVCYQSATVRGPGLVERTGTGETVVGSTTEEGEAAARRAVEILTAAESLEARVSADVASVIWEKLVLNTAANPTAALCRLPASRLTGTPEMNELVDSLARETTAVANAVGYEIDAEQAVGHVHEVLAGAGEGKGSMLQDVEAGRRTEIDAITGAVLRAAETASVEAPLNKIIYALIQGYESTLVPR